MLTVLDAVALKPSEACGVLLGKGCGSPYDPFNQNWTVSFPSVKKPPVSPIRPPLVNEVFLCSSIDLKNK